MDTQNAIAIDVGATNTRVALIDSGGHLLYKNQRPTIQTSSNPEFINFLRDFIEDSLSKREINNSAGIGISIAGFIDTSRGILTSSPNLPNKNLEIVNNIENYFLKKVFLNNDANAALLGEKQWGHGKLLDNFAYVTFSSGIGGGVFVDNKLVCDDVGNSIELGHITIDSEYNLPCGCGGVNHWEAYSSGKNIPNFLKAWSEKNKIKLDFDGTSIQTIFGAINAGNKQANQFFEQVMKINLTGINYLITTYQPEIIVLGGSVYLHHQKIFNKYLPQPSIFKPAFFGDNDPLVGSTTPMFASK